MQREIAQRQQAQQEHARLVAIFEATTDLVGMSDPQGKLLYLNRAGRILVNIADDANVTTTTIADYHPAAIADYILNEAVPAANRTGAWSGETVLLTHDNHEIPVSQVILAHRGADGKVSTY